MKKILLIAIVAVLAVGFSSCKGAAGRRVAQEAVEALSKKGASKGAKLLEEEGSNLERRAATLEREATVLEEEEANASSSYRSRRHDSHLDDAYQGWNSDDDDDNQPQRQQRQPQLTYITCTQCGGYGQVYMRDAYGNLLFDYYGNALVMVCPGCNGVGVQAVYQ